MWLWTTLAFAAGGGADADTVGEVEALLVEELDRVRDQLFEQPEPPHHVAVTVQDWEEVAIHARDGALSNDTVTKNRTLDVDLRTGTPELDSTHPLRGFSSLSGDDRMPLQVALDEGYALRHALWRELDARYRDAAERIVVIRANQNVLVAEETVANDFEPRPAVVERRPVPPLQLDREAWSDALVKASAALHRSDSVHTAMLSLAGERVVTTLVDSVGTRLVHGRRHVRVSLTATSTADDGDEVSVFRALDVHDPERLPGSDRAADLGGAGHRGARGSRRRPPGSALLGPGASARRGRRCVLSRGAGPPRRGASPEARRRRTHLR